MIGDAARIRQVAQNLLANAVKFTPARGTIHVRLSRGRDGIELVVRDDGEGIDPAFLPHVFDRFRMADAGITRRHGGLGLGLAIARCIVEESGGTIEAQSEGRGLGATFTVRLPILPPHSGLTPPQPSVIPAVPDLKGLRVLVVDDEADTRGLIVTLLELSGAVVEQADGAAAALAAIERRVPDVMISDLAMPGQDGLTLLRGLRRLPPERGGAVRAVALTAYARSEDRARALAAGFDAHVGKPIDPAELLTVVARFRPR
jgi:CheY-like chemotaxis protein/anti-sigma regulatory factor (Ser/Thr protein kinase)